MTMQYELYKIMKYQKKLKYSTQKSKNLIYKYKLNYHLNNLNQHGGIFYIGDFKKEHLDNRHMMNSYCMNMFNGPDSQVVNELIGRGASGVVFAFSRYLVIKYIEDLTIFRTELVNNNLVNILSEYNPFFPKYHYMDIIVIEPNQHHSVGKTFGVIISDRLSPIYGFFQEFRNNETNITNINFRNDFSGENREAFYIQFYFILYSIYDLYRKTSNILLHNDVKMDNFLIKEIIGNDNTHVKMTLFNNSIVYIPFIVYNDRKYILILHDYGNSYTYNSQSKIESFPSADGDESHTTLKVKFLENTNVSNDQFKIDIIDTIMNLSYIDKEILNMQLMDDIDKFIYADSMPYFRKFKENLTPV